MPTRLPLGEPVEFTPVPRPARQPLRGRHVVVRPMSASTDAESLWQLVREARR